MSGEFIYDLKFSFFSLRIWALKRKYYVLKRPKYLIERESKGGRFTRIWPKQ